jgi:hypothetical protein
MSEEPLDSCGIYGTRETPQERSDEEAPGPPHGKGVVRSEWNFKS